MTTSQSMVLKKPLFYLSPFGIRFEIGDPSISFRIEKEKYLQKAYERALEIFNSLFSAQDEILLVVHHNQADESKMDEETLKEWNENKESEENVVNGEDIFQTFVDENVVVHVVSEEIPFLYQEDDGEELNKTTRYTLSCKVGDLDVEGLLKAIIHTEFPDEGELSTWSECYFVDEKRNRVFHLYDDRGLDVVSTEKEPLQNLFENFEHYILAYDRPKIDLMFKKEAN